MSSERSLRLQARGVPTPTCRHFWGAGDYKVRATEAESVQGRIDHLRVHPKFLHSNATAHKWAFGAVAELLDNAVDEVRHGATFVKVDKIVNPRDNSPALLVQDDGGGMTLNTMRECMSLGYSRKHKNSIGRYGNGFKTSTMRLGADVIVFSTCTQRSTVHQSIGLLSFTFLRETGQDDVVVPMINYAIPRENFGKGSMSLRKIIERNPGDSTRNLESILKWSPYASEAELLEQFEDVGMHGTKVIVYNLWLNSDQNKPELDFDTDGHDIQLNRDEKEEGKLPAKQQLALCEHISNQYRRSLRVYSSILYLTMPPGFRIILRGKTVEHYNLVPDLLEPYKIKYTPKVGVNGVSKGSKAPVIRVGFAKEARAINVHGFNVYHKNRLIMPFWKVLQENSSRGRGVMGVLEANFIEPAHDKQDFEKTDVFVRLEARLKKLTVDYWTENCAKIGYQQKPRKVGKSLRQATIQRNLSGPSTSSAKGPGTRVRLSAPQGSPPSVANPTGSQVETEVTEVPRNSSKRSRFANEASQVETQPIDVPHNSSKRSRFARQASQVETEQIDVPHNSPKGSRSAKGASPVETEPVHVPHNSSKKSRSVEAGVSEVEMDPIDVPQKSPKRSRLADGASQDVPHNSSKPPSSANRASEVEYRWTNYDQTNESPPRNAGGTTESALLGEKTWEKDLIMKSLRNVNIQLKSQCQQYQASDVEKQDLKVKNMKLHADVQAQNLTISQLKKKLHQAEIKVTDLHAAVKARDENVVNLNYQLAAAQQTCSNRAEQIRDLLRLTSSKYNREDSTSRL